jgi:hypothetical protein
MLRWIPATLGLSLAHISLVLPDVAEESENIMTTLAWCKAGAQGQETY